MHGLMLQVAALPCCQLCCKLMWADLAATDVGGMLHLGVPVAVVDDDSVCSSQRDALAARARRQQEHKCVVPSYRQGRPGISPACTSADPHQ